jgi:signal peptidase I
MLSILDSIGSFFLEIIQTVAIVLSIFLVLYLFILQPHQVNGLSMYPNFENGDYLLTDKVSYKTGTPKRGDVVVFHAPPAAQCPEGTGCDFIKRILGLPGEVIEVKDNGIWVNGVKIDESSYIHNGIETRPGAYTQNRTVSLGSNEYFVAGDNRPHSSDSRSWGPITPKEIVGKAFFRYWPFTHLGFLATYEYQL